MAEKKSHFIRKRIGRTPALEGSKARISLAGLGVSMSKGNVNKVILVGHVGQDPELRHTAKGSAVLSLSVATNRDIKTADGLTKEETHWHRATVWGKRAESCAKYLSKGSRVYVEGILQMKSWTDKDGQNRKSTEILVDEIKFLGGGSRVQPLVQELEAPALSQ